MRAIIFLSVCFLQSMAGANPSDRLKGLGFTLLEAQPIELELVGLDGQRAALSDFKGRWVLVAFWATWCGPCVQEMPALDSLYREHKAAGLSVVGVSVDQDRLSVEGFSKEKNLSFPLFWDGTGVASSKYQATALPTLYVISPDWKLAGVMRGARDWSSSDVKKEISALLRYRTYENAGAGIKMAEQGGVLSLPNNLVPPELSARFEKSIFKKGETHPLTVFVHWKGNPKDYLIKVPRLTLPEGIIQKEVVSLSMSDHDSATLQYRFSLFLEKQGHFKLGPVEIAYSPRAGGQELFSRNDGVTIEVTPKSAPPVWVLAVGALVALLTGGVVVARRTRKKKPMALVEERDWQKPYETIRQMKLRGDRNQYPTALLKLVIDLDKASGLDSPNLVSLLEKVQFSGHIISDDELESFEKKIERSIKEAP